MHIIGYGISRKGNIGFYAVNPATGSELEPEYAEATIKEINDAVLLAENAFFTYKNKSSAEKANFLEKISDNILLLGDELILRCIEETGLTKERLVSERDRTVNQLKLFASLLREGSWAEAVIDTPDPSRMPVPKPDIRKVNVPRGPVLVFGAGNFPLAFSVAGVDTASALAAGCPVVVKGHPCHPGTSELTGQAIISAAQSTGMPEGIFSLLHGRSIDIGMTLVNHPKIKAVGFTGSFRGGKSLYDAAVRRKTPIPVYAEMGSINPVIILPEAMLQKGEEIAIGLAGSVILGTGQFCTNPGIVAFVNSRETDLFTKKLSKLISETEGGVMLSERIRHNYNYGIENLERIREVEILARGKTGSHFCCGIACLAKTSGYVFVNNTVLSEEIFGPSTIIVEAEDIDELLNITVSLPGQLTISIHGTENDLDKSRDLIRLAQDKAGRLIFNGFPTGVEVCSAMHHGGPYPATFDARNTSVGTEAIKRFVRPLCFQDTPEEILPDELKNNNPLDIWRLVDREWTKRSI